MIINMLLTAMVKGEIHIKQFQKPRPLKSLKSITANYVKKTAMLNPQHTVKTIVSKTHDNICQCCLYAIVSVLQSFTVSHTLLSSSA